MAQLKDTIVSGNLRVTDTTLTDTLQVTTIKAPTSAGGTTYGPGSDGQVLKSNGTTTYWGADNNSSTVLQSSTTTSNFRPFVFGTKDTTTISSLADTVTGQLYTSTRLFFQPSSGNLYMYSPSGDSPALIFQRGTFIDGNLDWKMYDTGGALRFAQAGRNTSTETWVTVVEHKTATNTASTPAIRSMLGVYGTTYGNTAANMLSGTAGLFQYGDGGPQIDFSTTPGGTQSGALIFTDHDSAATGASWHFVSTESDWNVTSKRFHAKTSISIGTNLPNTSYNLYVNGTTNITGATTVGGLLTTQANQYGDNFNSGAIDMQNSNLCGVNAIYTGDTSDNAAEGIHFYRDSTHVDTLWMSGGVLLFVPNRELGSDTSAANSQKVARFTVNPTGGQVVITDSTSGGVKSSGYTIATSVPSGAVFTDTKVTSSANHYTPATASGSDKSASASGATAAWSIDVVKGVTLNTDGKGHVTGISVTSGKIPANPVPSNNVTGSGTSGYLAKWDGTNTITNGPQLGSSTTTFLRNDGSWATPTDTDEKVKVDLFTSTTSTDYMIPGATAAMATTAAHLVIDTADGVAGVRMRLQKGTTSAVGKAMLMLGNNIASGTAKNMQGSILMYASTAYYGTITEAALTDNRTWTMPNKTGTVALTSDIPSFSVTPSGTGPVVTGMSYSSGVLTYTKGRVLSTSGGQWIAGRDNAPVLANSNSSTAGSFYPMGAVKTNTGAWAIGALGNGDSLAFSFSTDTNYSGGSNTTNNYYIGTDGAFTGTAAGLTAKALTAETFGTTDGSFVFKGTSLFGGTDSYDWVGIQADASNDMFQLVAGGNNGVFFREKDDSSGWSDWYALLTNAMITGSSGITVTPATFKIGGDAGTTINSGVTISHSNSITESTSTVFKKFSYDACGHITGVAAVAKADIPQLDYIGAKSNGSYWGMTTPANDDTQWIRTSKRGIIPYQLRASDSTATDNTDGSTCYLGTSTWYFAKAYIQEIYGTSFSGTAEYANGLTAKTLTAETLGTTDGSFVFKGTNLLGATYDWVGFQADAANDKFQIVANNQLMFRQKDSTTWSDWAGCLTPNNVSATSGLKVTATTTTIGTGDTGLTYNSGVKIEHDVTISDDSTSTGTLTHGGTFTAITSVTRDSYGHVTTLNTKTYTLPASGNTDTKVNVTLGTTTKAYLLGTTTTPTSSAQAVTSIADTGVYLDTTAGRLTASTFKGGLYSYNPASDQTLSNAYPTYTVAYFVYAGAYGGTTGRTGNSGSTYWAHYLTFTHSDRNYRYLLRFPYWGPPQYQHTNDGENKRWCSFITDEHAGNYSKYMGTGTTIDPITGAMNCTHRANKLAFLPAANITVQTSTDSGSTWTNLSVSDDLKRKIFSLPVRNSNINIGPSSGNATTSMQTRIIIECDGRDAVLDRFMFEIGSGRQKIAIDVYAGTTISGLTKIATGDSSSTWAYEAVVTIDHNPDKYYRFSTSNYKYFAFVFRYTYVDSSYLTERATINGISGYSGNYWGNNCNSNLAHFDHLYSWDIDQNALFPATVQGEKLAIKSGTYTTTIEKGATSADRTLVLPDASGGIGVANILLNDPTNSTNPVPVYGSLSDYDYFTIVIGMNGSNSEQTSSAIIPAIAGSHFFLFQILESVGSGGSMMFPAGVVITTTSTTISFSLGVNRGINIPSSGTATSIASARTAYIKMIIGHKS